MERLKKRGLDAKVDVDCHTSSCGISIPNQNPPMDLNTVLQALDLDTLGEDVVQLGSMRGPGDSRAAGLDIIVLYKAALRDHAVYEQWLQRHKADDEPPPVRRESPDRLSAARRPAKRVTDARDRPVASNIPMTRLQPPDPAAIRKSALPEWMRFRHEHSHLAFSVESEVRAALEAPVSIHKVAHACVAKVHSEAISSLDLSAELELDGRAATVRGWGCETADKAVAAAAICDCLLAHLPENVHVAVPTEVADEDLETFHGLLSLHLWL